MSKKDTTGDELPFTGTPQFADKMREHFDAMTKMLCEMIGPETAKQYLCFSLGCRIDRPAEGVPPMILVTLRGNHVLALETMSALLRSMALEHEKQNVCDRTEALRRLTDQLWDFLEKADPLFSQTHQ